MLRRVDINNEILLPVERLALKRMIEKRDYYLENSRHQEAHGCASAILIMWMCITDDFCDTLPTDWADV